MEKHGEKNCQKAAAIQIMVKWLSDDDQCKTESDHGGCKSTRK